MCHAPCCVLMTPGGLASHRNAVWVQGWLTELLLLHLFVYWLCGLPGCVAGLRAAAFSAEVHVLTE